MKASSYEDTYFTYIYNVCLCLEQKKVWDLAGIFFFKLQLIKPIGKTINA